jgi:hypothetical protein
MELPYIVRKPGFYKLVKTQKKNVTLPSIPCRESLPDADRPDTKRLGQDHVVPYRILGFSKDWIGYE